MDTTQSTDNYAFVTLRGTQNTSAGGKTVGVEQRARKSGKLWKLHSRSTNQYWSPVWVRSALNASASCCCGPR